MHNQQNEKTNQIICPQIFPAIRSIIFFLLATISKQGYIFSGAHACIYNKKKIEPSVKILIIKFSITNSPGAGKFSGNGQDVNFHPLSLFSLPLHAGHVPYQPVVVQSFVSCEKFYFCVVYFYC